MTILAIDVGNSRIKWGFHRDGKWLSLGALPKTNVGELAKAWADGPSPTRIIGCNVGGTDREKEIDRAVNSWGQRVEWIVSRDRDCGVINGYDEPKKLGADRWASLIAARHRTGSACVVLSSGTAVTIDAMRSSGEFVGGVIIPGPDAMADILDRYTAGLKRQPGKFRLFPTNTADAITTGALIAVSGALARIEQALLDLGEVQCEILLTGGGGADLREALDRPVALVPNLVLEGLIVIASKQP
jgi:type III pantothenate kinase